MNLITVNQDITLKTPTIKDAPHSFSLLQNDRAELMDIFNFVTADSTIEDEIDFVNSMDADRYFNIFYKDDVCGKIGVFAYSEQENSFEIYYFLGSSFRGRGIAAAAIQAFCRYVFSTLNADKIKFFINVDNHQSIQTAKRLNLKFIETVAKRDFCNGKYHDQHLYEMYSS